MNSRSFASIHYLVMSLLVAFFAASNHAACEPIWASDCAERVPSVASADHAASITAKFLPQYRAICEVAATSGDDLGLRARRYGNARWSFRECQDLCLVTKPRVPGQYNASSSISPSVAVSVTLSSVRIQV